MVYEAKSGQIGYVSMHWVYTSSPQGMWCGAYCPTYPFFGLWGRFKINLHNAIYICIDLCKYIIFGADLKYFHHFHQTSLSCRIEIMGPYLTRKSFLMSITKSGHLHCYPARWCTRSSDVNFSIALFCCDYIWRCKPSALWKCGTNKLVRCM